ncbi:MAG: RimK family alpha-L-glutamate ligase, partial [Nanoarchaeota archaeon]
MKSAIVSLQSKSSMMIAEAMQKYFDDFQNLDIRKVEVSLSGKDPEILYEGKEFGKYDCILARGSFRYVPLLSALTTAMEKSCYMPIRSGTFTIGHDKLITHLVLQEHKIPMPTTYLTSSVLAAKQTLEKINYPIIMKFPQGTQGKGVMFAESFAAAASMMDALETLRQPFILQEYIETGGADIRAIVVGDKVVAAMKRKAVRGEKRSNIHAGGVGETIELDNVTKRIAVNTAEAIGADICAIDILDSSKGPLVIEVNLSPGLQGITKTTGIDVADKIAAYLYTRTKECCEEGKKIHAEQILKELSIEKKGPVQNILTNLDFRGDRILLPKVVTDITGFNEKQELLIKAKKGKLEIGRYK